MKFYHFGLLLLLTSCATKYLIPGNRFITPESQGDAFRGQLEFQQASATNLTIDTSQGTVDHGVLYEEVTRTGFLLSNSVFNKVDVIWSHTGGSNSLLGGKFQFMGDPRIAKSAGHKASVAALFGGNEHETDDKDLSFELTGREYLALYGYRISEAVLIYTSFSLATYNFNGKISSNNSLDGMRPEYVTNSKALNGGFEFTYEAFFAKVEATYQKLETDHTKDKDRFIIGYSLGYAW
jgi:hypothetical protein